jgi:hypothetical protein
MTRAETFGGFARFTDFPARDAFVRDVLDRRPELRRHATPARTRPEIVFEDLSPAELATVRQAVNGRGRWFGDVQFEPAG